MKSRVKSGFLLLALGVVCFALPRVLFAASPVFMSTLRLGSYGDEVLALQKLLNSDPGTRILGDGNGSLGKETHYFGLLTKDAVIRFQEKHAAEILTPNGLIQGTGIVGLATREVLNAGALKASADTPASLNNPLHVAPPPVGAFQNPNQENLEAYLSELRKEGAAQGYAPTTIALIETEIRKDVATTTDLKALFFKKQQEAYLKKIATTSPLTGFFERVIALLGEELGARRALAGVGVPFGGYVAYVNPFCTCSPGVSQLFIALPGPVNPAFSNILLHYVTGTEAFSWYNLPLPSIATKGIYTPGLLSCYLYVGTACVPLPGLGTITPETGSSLVL